MNQIKLSYYYQDQTIKIINNYYLYLLQNLYVCINYLIKNLDFQTTKILSYIVLRLEHHP